MGVSKGVLNQKTSFKTRRHNIPYDIRENDIQCSLSPTNDMRFYFGFLVCTEKSSRLTHPLSGVSYVRLDNGPAATFVVRILKGPTRRRFTDHNQRMNFIIY